VKAGAVAAYTEYSVSFYTDIPDVDPVFNVVSEMTNTIGVVSLVPATAPISGAGCWEMVLPAGALPEPSKAILSGKIVGDDGFGVHEIESIFFEEDKVIFSIVRYNSGSWNGANYVGVPASGAYCTLTLLIYP
jgi:hypothetical protein